MVKLAIFVYALLAFGYTEVMSDESLQTLQRKVVDLEATTESNVTAARDVAANTLELLRQRAMELLFPTVNSVTYTTREINVRFNVLKNQTGDKDITKCLPIENNLYNVSHSIVSRMHRCLLRKVDEGSALFRETNILRDEARMAVENLKEAIQRCETQATSGCLINVNHLYETVLNDRVPQIVRNITNQEFLINDMISTIGECAPSYDPATYLTEASDSALAQFRECLQNL